MIKHQLMIKCASNVKHRFHSALDMELTQELNLMSECRCRMVLISNRELCVSGVDLYCMVTMYIFIWTPVTQQPVWFQLSKQLASFT